MAKINKGSATKTEKLSSSTLKPKAGSGLPEIKLSEGEIKAIENAGPGKSAEKLKDLIKSKLPKDLDTSKIDLDNLPELYGIKTSGGKWSWRRPFKINPGTDVNTSKFNMDTKTVYRNPNEMSWYN